MGYNARTKSSNETLPPGGVFAFLEVCMNQPGQPSYSLFPGIDSDNLKTFVLEVDSYRTEDALFALEKAILQIKLAQRHFLPERSSENGVRATCHVIR